MSAANREAAVDAIVRRARTVAGLAGEIVDALARAEAAEAEVARLRAELAAARSAAREAAQVLIAETGATGPMDVGDAARRAAGRISALTIDRDSLRAECERLRAIVEGRTTAPTDAELEAHEAADGSWLYRGPGGSTRCGRRYARGTSGEPAGGGLPILVRSTRRSAELGEPLGRWWPLDASGRPCAWPTPALDAAGEGR